ncbi:hypothetical protein [Phenylobacterium sp.]|uniref:hypothetical protein n=1 Tax=Phenylobacterium sp. TaxID=1871053 RepID=UPI004036ABD0
MAPQKTLLGLTLGLGLFLLAGAAPERAEAGDPSSACCTPPPPPCCKPPPPPPPPPKPPCCAPPGHGVKVPSVNVVVAPTVVVNASASATVNASARASAGAGGGSAVYYGGGGGGGGYSPPMATGVIQGLNVEGARRMKRTAYQATRSATRRVVIQAVCIDDRQTPHPAAQLFPERDVRDIYDGELYRCVAGARLQVTIAEFSGQIDFSGGQTLVCAKGEALYHAPGGQVTCRPQKAARDCNERSLLRRFGAGVKILTMVSTETYTAYREEEEISESSSSMALSLDGGVGGTVY